MLFDSIRTMCAQFIVDAMDSINGVFTDLLSCDLSLFEELFSVAGELYRNAILPMGIALLLLICTWQLFKTMFGRLGTNAEEPVELVGRSLMCLFMVVYAKPMVDYILNFAGTPYGWITGNGITVASFSEFTSAAELAAGALGIDTLSIQLLLLILQFVVAWNYFKLLFAVAERYVLLGVFSYTAPLAFATGGSKATNNVLSSWAKNFGGQIVLIILDAWGLKLYLSAYGNLMASSYGFTKFFVGCLMLIGFCKIMQKLDSYLASLGLNLGRTSPGMSGTALAMMAGRMLGHAGGSRNETPTTENSPSGGGSGESGCEESSFTAEAAPIPMSNANAGNMPDTDIPGEAGNHVENGFEAGNNENNDGVQHISSETDGDRRNVSDADSKKEDREKKQEDASDPGIIAGYDDETWKSRREEAACMEAAIDAMDMEDIAESGQMDGVDTGIVSSPCDPEEESLLEPDGYEPVKMSESWKGEAGAEASETDRPDGNTPEMESGNEWNVHGTGKSGDIAQAQQSLDIAAQDLETSGAVQTDIMTGRTENAGKHSGAWQEGNIQDADGKAGTVTSGNAGSVGKAAGAGKDGDTEVMAETAAFQTAAFQSAASRMTGLGTKGMKKMDSNSPDGNGDAGKKDSPNEQFCKNGMMYLSADAFEEPEIPYQMEHRNGQQYYAVPQEAAEGGVRAQLQEDGSIRYEKTGDGSGWSPKKKDPRQENAATTAEGIEDGTDIPGVDHMAGYPDIDPQALKGTGHKNGG